MFPSLSIAIPSSGVPPVNVVTVCEITVLVKKLNAKRVIVIIFMLQNFFN